MTSKPAPSIRVDLQLIAQMIKANSRVLDVGCGDGMLLAYLQFGSRVELPEPVTEVPID